MGRSAIVRELLDRVSTNTQDLCGDFSSTIGVKNQGATAVSRNPLLSLVAGARFELWKRPALDFDFLLSY
jgi:hypothetical protein